MFIVPIADPGGEETVESHYLGLHLVFIKDGPNVFTKNLYIIQQSQFYTEGNWNTKVTKMYRVIDQSQKYPILHYMCNMVVKDLLI